MGNACRNMEIVLVMLMCLYLLEAAILIALALSDLSSAACAHILSAWSPSVCCITSSSIPSICSLS
jgi:hypothetical protein